MIVMDEKVNNLIVKIYHDRPAMGKAAAEMVIDKIKELLKRKSRANIVFASAPSQNEFLDFLAADKEVEWNRVNAFHMDEYVGLDYHDQQSFGYFLKNKLFDKIPIGGIYYLNGRASAISLEAQRYSDLLVQYPTDIVCLGIGENTHIAFNDPHTADFNDVYRVKSVELDIKSRLQQVNDGCFPDIASVPTHALTLTVPSLLSAENLYCIVPGKNKAPAIAASLLEDISEKYPSTILRRHSSCVLFLDEQSAAIWKGNII